MKTYKEYKKDITRRYWEHINNISDQWWKNHENNDSVTIKGDYIETVLFLSEKEKNDTPIIENHSNIKNSEWCILFEMLAQALIDWCIENNNVEFWEYSITINRELDEKNNDIFYYTHSIKNKFKDKESVSPDIYDECSSYLCDMVSEFMKENGKNIPNEWNDFYFSLDGMLGNCVYGKWTPYSDGSLILGNLISKEIFITCM